MEYQSIASLRGWEETNREAFGFRSGVGRELAACETAILARGFLVAATSLSPRPEFP